MKHSLLTIVMWMLMILVKVTLLLCSVTLTRLIAAPMKWVKLELESGTFPMELVWELRVRLKMNFTEIEEHKLYASIIDKAHLQKEDFSDVKYQILTMSRRLFM